MKMHLLSGGRLRMRNQIYLPTADRSETFELPVPSALLRHPQGNVLFDTGCNPAVASDPQARWNALARVMTPVMGPDDNVLSGLVAVGLEPDDVDVVVRPHLHPDHCGCKRIAAGGATVLYGHDDRQWATLRKGADAYE
jgi:N-acyl homoserine lactone hydrolase